VLDTESVLQRLERLRGGGREERALLQGSSSGERKRRQGAAAAGERTMTSPVVEQFAFVTMKPPVAAQEACARTSCRWPPLTGGTTSGTSGAMR